MIESGFMGMVFQIFLHFPDLWVQFFCKNSSIGELFWHFRTYGYIFEKFLRIHGWYFYNLNGTTTYRFETMRFQNSKHKMWRQTANARCSVD